MPKWGKIALRVVGVLNSAALLLGLSLLADNVYEVLIGRMKGTVDEPYFYIAFATMAIIEIAFALVFLVASFRFARYNLSLVNLYSVAVALYIAYDFSIGFFIWPLRGGIGESVAAATGVSSGTVPFAFLLFFVHPMPFPLYPAVTVVLVQMVKWRSVKHDAPVPA